jgi:hypothetical protein
MKHRVSFLVLTLTVFVWSSAMQSQSPGSLVVSVTDTAGHGVDGARLVLSPRNRIGRTPSMGVFVFPQLRVGIYRLEIHRLGFSPVVLTVDVPTAGTKVEVQLTPLPQQLAATIISERTGRLPRVYERQSRHLGHVLFAEDLPRYRAFGVSDLFRRVPEFYAMLNRTKSCRNRQIFVDASHLPPGMEVDDYVKPDEVEAIEVYPSADFIHEDFLSYAPDPPTPRPTQSVGAIRLGTRPPRVSQGLSGTCSQVVMIWTKWYRPPKY